MPEGARRARGQAEWLRAVAACPDVAELRVDAREHVTALAWALARTASWTELTTRPTWPLLMERTGLSRRTVARWLAWLQAAGLLVVVESGTTPRYSPMTLAVGAANRAALYALRLPAATAGNHGLPPATPLVVTSGTPTILGSSVKDPFARANGRGSHPGPLRGPDGAEDGESWPRTRDARSRSQRLELVRRLQLEAPDLRRLGDRALRHLLRPWLLAGWTVADLLWALDHEPGGTERTWTTGVRSPGGWLLARLQPWTITPGVARSPLSVELRASESAAAAEANMLRAEHADAAAVHDASLAFGCRLESVTGPALYAELLEQVAERQFAGARLRRAFAAAASALVRTAVRAELCPACRDDVAHDGCCHADTATDAQLLTAAQVVAR